MAKRKFTETKLKKRSHLGRHLAGHLFLRMFIMAIAIVAATLIVVLLSFMRFYEEQMLESVYMLTYDMNIEQDLPLNEEQKAEFRERMYYMYSVNPKLNALYIAASQKENEAYFTGEERSKDGYKILLFTDNDPNTVDRKKEGEFQEYPYNEKEIFKHDLKNVHGNTSIIFDTDNHLNKITVLRTWCPIYDREGNASAVIVAECDMNFIVVGALTFSAVLLVIILLDILLVLIFTLIDITKRVIYPLNLFNKGIDSYQNGQFDFNLNLLKYNDDLFRVAQSFENMSVRVHEYTEEVARITAEQERLSAELNIGADIQSGLLPDSFDEFSKNSKFDVYAIMKPAREVGGDFYDFFEIDKDHTAFVIADVSGKGVPAALYMVIVKTLIEDHATSGLAPDIVIGEMNKQLMKNEKLEMFVTIWFGIYEHSTKTLSYVNAGHEYPAIYRAGTGKYEMQYEDHDFVCGSLDDVVYTLRSIEFDKGDRLFLYTDGLAEAMNKKEAQFGDDRIIAALNETLDSDPKTAVQTVHDRVMEFSNGAEQHDDLTMLMIYL